MTGADNEPTGGIRLGENVRARNSGGRTFFPAPDGTELAAGTTYQLMIAPRGIERDFRYTVGGRGRTLSYSNLDPGAGPTSGDFTESDVNLDVYQGMCPPTPTTNSVSGAAGWSLGYAYSGSAGSTSGYDYGVSGITGFVASDEGDDVDRQGRVLVMALVGTTNDDPTGSGGLGITSDTSVFASGETLTADVTSLEEANGLSGVTFNYLWERLDPSDDSVLPVTVGTDSPTYTLTPEDAGLQIRVTVSYTDEHCYENERVQAQTIDINAVATGAAVDGNHRVGETLTANTDGIRDGNGLGTPTYTYTWERAPSATPQASDITDITDAADTTPESYELVAADGMNFVRVTVRFEDAQRNSEVVSSDWTEVAAAANQPATGLMVTGDYRVGETLTAVTSGITDPDVLGTPTYTYTWERAPSATPQASDIMDITDAADTTPESYELVDADRMNFVRVTVTFSDSLNNPERLSSDWTEVGTGANMPASGLRITSLARVGDTLEAITDDIVDPDDLPASPSFTYVWERAPDDAGAVDDTRITTIAGAVDSEYTLVEADRGHWVRVTATFDDADGNEETLNSDWRQVEPALNTPADGSMLAITGEARVGEVLTAATDGITDEDGLTGVTYEFQWSRVDADGTSNPEDISGATEETYTLQDADIGRRVRVTIAAFQDDEGNDEGPFTSPNSATVQGQDDSAQMARDRATVEMFLNRFGAGMTAQVLEAVHTRIGAPRRAPGMRGRFAGYAFGDAAAAPLGAARRAPGNTARTHRAHPVGAAPAAHTYTGGATRATSGTYAGGAHGASSDGADGFGAASTAHTYTGGATRATSGTYTGGAAPGASTDEAVARTDASAGRRAHPAVAVLGAVSGLGSPSADTSGMREHTFAALYGETPGAVALQASPPAGPAADAPFAGMPALSGTGLNPGAGGSQARPFDESGPAAGPLARRSLSLSLPSVQSLLGASSFSFTRVNSGGGLSSVWARGDYSSFEADQGPQHVDGDMTTAQLGADWSSGPWLAGLMALHSEADSDYRQEAEGGKGDIEATMTGVYPYLGYRFTERLSAWGTLGYGTGELTLAPQRRTSFEADLELMMGALGVRDQVLRPRAAGGLSVSLRADAVFTRSSTDAVAGRIPEAQTDSYRVRFGAEGMRNTALSGGAQLSRSIEFGVLVDGGDLTQGGGMELGGAVAYARASGLAVDFRWRGSFVDGVVDTRQWGVSGGLSYDPSPASARGISLSLESGYGGPASGGVEELFARRITDALETGGGGERPGARLSAELGYGVSALGGRFTGTPWARIGLAESGANWRLGWRITPFGAWAPALRTGIEYGGRGRGVAEHEIRLKLDTRF